ncbi:MAG: polysaccharide biosynthesis/export family protein [Gammaproteobacteria bacterium]
MNCRRLCFLLMTVVMTWSAQSVIAQSGTDYRLNTGDVLQVSVWNEDELNREVLVRPDGGISFPLVGSIAAADRTVTQVQEAIANRLESYIPDAVVTVAVLAVNGNKIYVLGKVARPGEYVMNSTLDVMQALSIAGGVTSFAAENKIRILRRGPTGAQQALPFRYAQVKEGNDLKTNILLQSGDVVVVP